MHAEVFFKIFSTCAVFFVNLRLKLKNKSKDSWLNIFECRLFSGSKGEKSRTKNLKPQTSNLCHLRKEMLNHIYLKKF